MSEYINTLAVRNHKDVAESRLRLIAILEGHGVPRAAAVNIVYDAYDLGFTRGTYVMQEN